VFKSKGPLIIRKDFAVLSVIYRVLLEQSFEVRNLGVINMALKILILESAVMKEQEVKISLYLEHLNQLQKHLNSPGVKKTIYLYQKCVVRALTRDSKIADDEIILLLNYL
jgi:hypothetical protein